MLQTLPKTSISLYNEDTLMNPWQVIHLLYITFRNVYIEENNNQIYIRIQVNIGVPEKEAQYVRVTGTTLEEATSTVIAALWRYIPDDVKEILSK